MGPTLMGPCPMILVKGPEKACKYLFYISRAYIPDTFTIHVFPAFIAFFIQHNK